MGKKSVGRVRYKQVGSKNGVSPENILSDIVASPQYRENITSKPDTSIVHVWPPGETFTVNFERFHVIWPTYMDSTKSVKHGRRICLNDAISEPTIYEISEALKSLHIRHVIQPYKIYPRLADSPWDNTGRVMIDLKRNYCMLVSASLGSEYDSNGLPNLEKTGLTCDTNGNVNKKVLMRKIVKIIPFMPSRIRRMEEVKKSKEQKKLKKMAEARYISVAKINKGGSTRSNKRKGRKKRSEKICTY